MSIGVSEVGKGGKPIKGEMREKVSRSHQGQDREREESQSRER